MNKTIRILILLLFFIGMSYYRLNRNKVDICSNVEGKVVCQRFACVCEDFACSMQRSTPGLNFEKNRSCTHRGKAVVIKTWMK